MFLDREPYISAQCSGNFQTGAAWTNITWKDSCTSPVLSNDADDLRRLSLVRIILVFMLLDKNIFA